MPRDSLQEKVEVSQKTCKFVTIKTNVAIIKKENYPKLLM